MYPADPSGLMGVDENKIGPDDHRAVYESALEVYGQQNSKRVEGRVLRALVVSALGKRSYKLLGIEKNGAASARRDMEALSRGETLDGIADFGRVTMKDSLEDMVRFILPFCSRVYHKVRVATINNATVFLPNLELNIVPGMIYPKWVQESTVKVPPIDPGARNTLFRERDGPRRGRGRHQPDDGGGGDRDGLVRVPCQGNLCR